MTLSAPKARNVIAWASGPGGRGHHFAALKARNVVSGGAFLTVLISRLQRYPKFQGFPLGRCPRLLHFAPLALRARLTP